MIRRRAFRLALLALAACGPTSVPSPRLTEPPREAPEDAPPPWPFADTILPAPPAQGTPTEPGPRPGLPEGLVRAVETLFRSGLADPRGLPYHEVSITLTTQPEGPGEVVATKGFVLPGPEHKPRFGVLWNGLVYPLVSVGPAADLRADIEALRASDKRICEQQTAHFPDMPCIRAHAPRPEIHSHRLEEILPMHVAILVQLGEDTLTRSVWERWARGGELDAVPEIAGRERDIFARLAEHFLHGLRDRGFWAHVRGDDALALASLRGLGRISPALSARAAALGASEQTINTLAEPPGPLLVDQEKRAARPAPKGLPSPLPADPAARVTTLVAALGEVREPAFGRSGVQAQVFEDPILQALLAEGEAAVLPLAEALANDERYTRSIWYEPHGIVLLTVRDVAELALDTLAADLPLAPAPPNETKTQKAERFKQAAETYKSLPVDERWFRDLADETAGPGRWVQAATRIVGPTDAPGRSPDASDFLALFVRVDGPPKPRFAGLVSRKNPSVTELLAQRMKQLAVMKSPAHLRASCEMGLLLALWDPKGAARPLREGTDPLRKAWKDLKDPSADDELGPCLAVLFAARGALGDERAFDEYASWIRAIDPATVPPKAGTLRTLLAPLALRPTRPSIVAAGRAMFGTKTSLWAVRFRRGERDDLLDPALLPIPGMRELALAALEDRSAVGTIELGAYGEVEWGLDGAGEFDREHEQVDPRDPGAAPSSTKMPLRACDRVAAGLARRIGSAAPFRMYWIETRRDDAISALRAFVVTKSEPPRAP
ncbi:hypothetical protein [Polyangium mundeleinium]|uniref:Lipoprotein n=1 Tax=Polyangium mundeleinium TaxID=2995306 RepID=A0ABT5ET25_9BACT|nr:hypothetical protein [Polyangium mundeleinium]MDC0744502.1 hypothetical protein [Polyangium mundeleinium]